MSVGECILTGEFIFFFCSFFFCLKVAVNVCSTTARTRLCNARAGKTSEIVSGKISSGRIFLPSPSVKLSQGILHVQRGGRDEGKGVTICFGAILQRVYIT